jgi:hypothetical protein
LTRVCDQLSNTLRVTPIYEFLNFFFITWAIYQDWSFIFWELYIYHSENCLSFTSISNNRPTQHNCEHINDSSSFQASNLKPCLTSTPFRQLTAFPDENRTR